MITITNPKIAGFQPIFSEFRGFSCLFEPLAGDENSASLYRLLHESLKKLGPVQMANTYLFCPLPFPSYHVTVWDGVNDSNVDAITTKHREYFRSYLKKVNTSLELEPPFQEWIANSPLMKEKSWEIRLKFRKLSLWMGGPVLVAQLDAADKKSEARLKMLEKERKALYECFEAELGSEMYRGYTPHISLGYFANEEGAHLAKEKLKDWNGTFAETLEGAIIKFDSISLYGFDDMANFFRLP